VTVAKADGAFAQNPAVDGRDELPTVLDFLRKGDVLTVTRIQPRP
jgi:hypothetical protein